MTRNEIIAEELAADPLGRGYAGMSDEAARNDMNTEYRVNEQGVWLSDAYQYLSHEMSQPPALNSWPVLVMLKELAELGTLQGTPEPTTNSQEIAINLMGFINKATDSDGQLIFLDFSAFLISFSFDTMRDIGVITQAQRDALPLLSDVPQSRGNELTVGTLTTFDITNNRA